MPTEADILNAPILVVDDMESNVRLIEGVLRVAGYTCVHWTTDPRQVCDFHRHNHYSLILLDLQMPGMDGFQVMEELKEIEADGYLPLLVITAQPDHKLRALAAGAKDFLTKPYDLAELRARIRNILEVRLLHLELKGTVRELEASRELIRLKAFEDRTEREQTFAADQRTRERPLSPFLPKFDAFNNQLPLHVREYAIPIAQHEVGHFVASRVLGFRTGGISLKIETAGRGYQGGFTVILSKKLASPDAIKDYLQRRVQVLYAGVLAQTLASNELRKADQRRAIELFTSEAGADHDYAKACEIVYALRGIQHCDSEPANGAESDAQLAAIGAELWSRAVSLVEEHAGAIMDIAIFLMSKMTFPERKIEVSEAELDSYPAIKSISQP